MFVYRFLFWSYILSLPSLCGVHRCLFFFPVCVKIICQSSEMILWAPENLLNFGRQLVRKLKMLHFFLSNLFLSEIGENPPNKLNWLFGAAKEAIAWCHLCSLSIEHEKKNEAAPSPRDQKDTYCLQNKWACWGFYNFLFDAPQSSTVVVRKPIFFPLFIR